MGTISLCIGVCAFEGANTSTSFYKLVYTAILSYSIQDLLPEQDMKDLCQKVTLTRHRSWGLDNLHLVKDWRTVNED
ncbi:ZNF678 isoform 1 [Pongo abelii]|uniref:ZNF678 isoform 1 n=1 Tax=Pongo abelii TaxID=9601 RepID=A0A2J8U1Y8_PONAB|nr:ZNF678 isoform 1 [Pongo abelii]